MDRKFDTAPMPWTIEKIDADSTETKEQLNPLKDVPKTASRKNIILICPAPDIGSQGPDVVRSYYPLRRSADGIFKIGVVKLNCTIQPCTGGLILFFQA
ncbi:hypothetical protein K504DRAFT_467021 [Pleomassaria siparia CBS 279.74]|uniref:Uncharacterized protein n=1 Tax=Pleomassaria siparia CBS 279.74 TaxID=1314801 RepID=A0A6G1KDB1_9PLEO|nr:hypothetical protein K504DRAFT_467021 [Pleomassaria siparia CBS 279.74]